MSKPWYRQKTTWAGILAVIGAVGARQTGDMTTAQAFQTAITGLIGIFLRQSTNKYGQV